MIRLFISRELSEESVFRNRLKELELEIIDQSLIEFSPVDIPVLPKAGWIFFYSKNAVKYLLDRFPEGLPINCRLAAMGEGTARVLSERDYTCQFIGNGNPKEVASNFLSQARGQRVIFARASNSRQSVQLLIEKEIEIVDLVVYQNQQKKDFNIPPCEILVFTSPMNVAAYFAKYMLDQSAKILAIGETTGAALRKAGVKKVYVPDAPGEKALANQVVQLVRQFWS